MATTTLRDRIGQLFMLGFTGKSLSPELTDFFSDLKPGGVILFSRNLESPAQIVELTNSLQKLAKADPLLIAIDQEGGRVSRLPNGFTIFPPCAWFGECNSAEMAYAASAVTANELRAVGVNMNMAPVLDVNTNPANPIIGDRAVSGDPVQVAELGLAIMRGLQENRVVACGKHFPGHGDTSADSHVELPTVQASAERLRQTEIYPFAQAIPHGLASIMTAHVTYPSLDPQAPATLSPSILTGILRAQLGFTGLIFTDDLEMRAIVDHHGIEEASIRALHAGADILLICKDPIRQVKAMEAVLHAVERGDISSDRIAASLARLAAVKQRYLHPYAPADASVARLVVGSRSHKALLDSIRRSRARRQQVAV
jgi:beta-N-acetylhexosaminidase